MLHELSRLSTDSVEAIAILPRQADFADRRQNGYLTLPYLLEAVFQTAVFQRILQSRDRTEAIALPYATERFFISRRRARCRVRSDSGAKNYRRFFRDGFWDAVAYDERQQRLLSVNALEMRWICL